MKSFEQWIADMAEPEEHFSEITAKPWGRVVQGATVQCCVCEEWFEADYEVAFDEHGDPLEEHWCGGSPRCCP